MKFTSFLTFLLFALDAQVAWASKALLGNQFSRLAANTVGFVLYLM